MAATTIPPGPSDSTRFLYTGDSQIQTGVTDALDRWRAGVARGLVKARGGEPLAGATVRVLPRDSETASKYGQTVTGENGAISSRGHSGPRERRGWRQVNRRWRRGGQTIR